MQRVQEIKERRVEILSMHAMTTRKNRRLQEEQELCEEEAEEMQRTAAERIDEPQRAAGEHEPTLGDILGHPPSKKTQVLSDDPRRDDRLLQSIKTNYDRDLLTRSVLAKPDNHTKYFRIDNGLIWTKNFRDDEVLCIPRETTS